MMSVWIASFDYYDLVIPNSERRVITSRATGLDAGSPDWDVGDAATADHYQLRLTP